MKILGFYHLLLINHWVETFSQQMKCMVDSGLYDVTDKIYIGCLGRNYEHDKLKILASDFPKIEIVSHSQDVRQYEFITLKILKHKVDTEDLFYGFYIHTKGISWPLKKLEWAYRGGQVWLAYMNYYNITRWKDCVQKLDEGYDACGVKLIGADKSPAYRLHYSGNFWWISSEYAKRLPPIESLNLNDRFQAEFYICSANANAATLCQDFIDYKTKGTFQPPVNG